jgi:hypothetical protein
MFLKHEEELHATANDEPEPPPETPSAMGKVMLRNTDGTSSEKSIALVAAAAFWPEDSTSVRQVVLVQLSDADEFAAFGIFPDADRVPYCCKVSFVVWGRASTDLDGFLQKMKEAGAEADWFSPVPLEDMRTRIDDIELKSAQLKLLAAVDWKRDPSNEDTGKRNAA